MKAIRDEIAIPNPVIRGWGAYFGPGNASQQFTTVDRFVPSRLPRLIGQGEGWKRRPFCPKDWPYTRFANDFDLYKLLGTIRDPGSTHATREDYR